MTFATAHFHVTTAQFVINCTLKYALTSQTDGRTDRQTTCDGNTALCTKVHRAVKTVEVRIMIFSPYGSPIHLVFAGNFHPEILRGSPSGGVKQGRGGQNQQFSL